MELTNNSIDECYSSEKLAFLNAAMCLSLSTQWNYDDIEGSLITASITVMS